MLPRSSRNVKIRVTILLMDSVPHEGNVKITLLREDAGNKSFRKYDISEFDSDGRAPVTVIDGTAFRVERLDEKYVLRCSGPLASEIIVSVI